MVGGAAYYWFIIGINVVNNTRRLPLKLWIDSEKVRASQDSNLESSDP